MVRCCIAPASGHDVNTAITLGLLLCLLPGAVLCGCSAPPQTDDAPKAEYRKITAEQAMNMMNDGDGWVLLDVRTEEEFAAQRIEGAVLIPDDEIAARVESEIADKDAIVLVYCRSGRRSENAARAMIDMGYTGVYDFGGIIDWPYDTVGAP